MNHTRYASSYLHEFPHRVLTLPLALSDVEMQPAIDLSAARSYFKSSRRRWSSTSSRYSGWSVQPSVLYIFVAWDSTSRRDSTIITVLYHLVGTDLWHPDEDNPAGIETTFESLLTRWCLVKSRSQMYPPIKLSMRAVPPWLMAWTKPRFGSSTNFCRAERDATAASLIIEDALTEWMPDEAFFRLETIASLEWPFNDVSTSSIRTSVPSENVPTTPDRLNPSLVRSNSILTKLRYEKSGASLSRWKNFVSVFQLRWQVQVNSEHHSDTCGRFVFCDETGLDNSTLCRRRG